MIKIRAVLDANVLYPAPLRDLLLQLAVMDVFQARWAEEIHQEWIGPLLRNERHATASLQAMRGLSKGWIFLMFMTGMWWRRPSRAIATASLARLGI